MADGNDVDNPIDQELDFLVLTIALNLIFSNDLNVVVT